MAKCLICNQKKGKRECRIVGGEICSLCCGTRRNDDECVGYEYFVLNRRTKGNRECMSVIQKYIGSKNGIRVL